MTPEIAELASLRQRVRELEREMRVFHALPSGNGGYAGFSADTAQPSLAEEQLRVTKEQLEALFRYAPEALFVADSSEQFVEVNPAACELLGYTRQEFLQLSIADLIAPRDVETDGRLRRHLAEGKAYTDEWELRHKSGERILVEITARLLPDQRIQAFVRDLRERRRFRETALLLAAIVESSDDAIISNDLSGIITSWNQGAEKIFGYTASEMIGRPLSILAVPERTGDMQAILEKICRGEKVDHYETVRRAKDGRDLNVSLSVSPLKNSAGEVIGASKIARNITERKIAEEALRRSEQELRFVFDHAPAFISYIGTDLRYIRVNKAYEDWFGLPASEIVGKHIQDTFGLQYFTFVKPLLEQAQRGESVAFDASVYRPNGESREMSVMYSPDLDNRGVVHGFIALLQDVTERRRQELALRERDEEMRRLLTALPDVISRFDLQFRFRYVSPAIERLTGVPSAAFFGKTCEQAGLPVPVSERLCTSLQSILENREANTIEFDFPSPSGIRHMVGIGLPETDSSGELVSILSIVRDITGQKRAEQERTLALAREREARETAEVLNGIGPSLAAELDLQRLVQSVTDVATRLVGAEFGSFFHNVITEKGESYILYTLSGVPRESFAKFPMPRNTEVFAPTFRGEGVVRSDDITQDPRYGRSAPYYGMPKGHLPVCSYLAVPVTSRSGEVLGGLFFGHAARARFTKTHEDLVVGLAAQAAIAMDNARLFEQSQWVQNELKRSNEDLRRANRDLETFAYSASHDLQEPLRMIAISAQLLARQLRDIDEDGRRFLNGVLEGSQRMQTLLQDLLSYTRATKPQEGAPPVVSSEVIFARVVQNLASTIELTAAQVTAGNLPSVPMHEIHLTQLLQNLVGNALKYRSTEIPHVHLCAEERDSSFVFSVVDNGIGIDSNYADQIFGLFKRLHTREEYPGSGIGLAICQRIIEQYGGRIWLEHSELGKGSVFSFSIPRQSATGGSSHPADTRV